MRNATRILMFALAAGNAFAQPGIPICSVARAIQWINETRDYFYHIEKETQCVNGTLHNLTYIYTFGNKGQVPLMDEDTGKPCSCPVGNQIAEPVIHQPFLSAPARPRQENNCESGAPYDNTMAATVDYQELLNLLTGATGPNPFLRPPARPALTPRWAAPRLEHPADRPRASASSSYAVTLPYRALPAGPLLLNSLPGVTPMCLSSVNPTYWETAHTDNVVKRFNACTGAVVATINVASLPLQVRVTPDGSQAVVTNFSSAITFIDTTSNTVRSVLQTPLTFTPSGLAISPDGRYALVTNLEPAGPNGAALGVVDLGSQTLTSMIPLDTDYPQSVFINPDATLAWVVFPFNGGLEVIDLLTGVTVQHFNFAEPLSVAFNPTGTVAYVAEGGGVQVIDTTTYALTSFVSTGPGPDDLLVTPDGAYLVVNNSLGASVSVIDTQTLAVSTQSRSGAGHGIVAVPVQ